MSMERDAGRLAALLGCGAVALLIGAAARRHEARESAASLARLRELARERFGPDQPFETAWRMAGCNGADVAPSWRGIAAPAAVLVGYVLVKDAIDAQSGLSVSFPQAVLVVILVSTWLRLPRDRLVLLAKDLVRAEQTWSELPLVLASAEARGENLDLRLTHQGFETPELRAWLVTRLLPPRREAHAGA